MAARLAATALVDSADFTWDSRVRKIAAIVESRLGVESKLGSAPAERGLWSRTQFRAWGFQSRRWLVHLVRERSFVLPPSAIVPAAHD